MGFTELNSVEHYIIHQMTGVNLNANQVSEPQKTFGVQWQFQSPEQLGRGVNEV
jgi:type I restriction enzyme R subunit